MDSKQRIGIVIVLTSLMLVLAHMYVIGDLIPRGVDPDTYAEEGGTALASRGAVPIGAAGIGLGVILMGWRKREDGAKPGKAEPPLPKSSLAIAGIGLALVAMHVAMLRDLTLKLEARERQPDFVAEGPEFEADRAKATLSLERINVIFMVGISLTFAGIVLAMNQGRKPDEPEPG